jgi:hypothetical protein
MGRTEEEKEQDRGIHRLFYGPTWKDTIMLEAQLRGARGVLMGVIEDRFGPVPQEIRTRIESIKSMDRMLRLARRSVTAKSLKGLRLG